LTAENASTPAAAVTVREAEVTDAAAIASLGAQAFRATHIGLRLFDVATIDAIIAQTYSVPALTACIAQCAAAPDAFFLVACAESSILGYLHYDNTGDEPELHRIYVTPHKKGTGIGTALLDALHTRLPYRASYRVTVAAANEPALRFYRRRGFTEETRIEEAYYPGVKLPPTSEPVPIVILRYTGTPDPWTAADQELDCDH
jgi:ribosomal protein S18 acetylase RimI-like enzyme